MTSHLEPLIKKLSKLAIVATPAPWERKASIAVGGLRAVGFDRERDLLLVVSAQGRGVVDCITGKKVERDDEEYYENEEHLEAEGIGPLSGKLIIMAGLFGGGLPTITADRWQLESVTLKWPDKSILLVHPGSDLFGSLYSRPDEMSKIAEDSTIRAYGFSHTGKSFVIATSSDVTVYARKDG